MTTVRSRNRYSTLAIGLHWSIAGLIILNIILAWRFDDVRGAAQFSLYQWHKSIGITVLLLSLLRLASRLVRTPPPYPDNMDRWERATAHAVHWAFYVAMIGLPLTGWLLVSTSPIRIPTLLYGAFPWPHVPISENARHAIHAFAEAGHEALSYALYALLALHVAGALKHHFWHRDEVFTRMSPFRLRSR